MNIGILTFHLGPNYGGYLQAWSLREAIRGLGHEAELVPYKNRRHHEDERFRWKLTPRLGLLYQQWRKARMWEEACREFHFGSARHEAADIDWFSYDTVVVGSDVVWDYQTPKFGQDPVFFGVVPGEGPGRWVSYAASCGKAEPSGLPGTMAAGLERFDSLGVRDEGSRRLVRAATGREAELVLDPTWLFDDVPPPPPADCEPVLAFYGYARVSPETARGIRSFADRHGLEIVAYGFSKPWADRCVLDLPPFEWVEALRRARVIVTGTFHGTLYAARLGKVFCTLGNEWIRNKITAPLAILGAEDHLVAEGDDPGPLLESRLEDGRAADYSLAAPARAASLKFLRRSLGPA